MSNRQTNEYEEQELGRLIQKRYPGMTAYQAIAQAYKDSYQFGKLGKIEERPIDDAYGEVFPTGPNSFDVAADTGMKTAPLPAGVDRDAWMLGVLGHEVLGHGGEQAYYGTEWWDPETKRNKPKGRHFKSSPYAGVKDDSIGWLIDKTKGRFSDIDEAKQRGLPWQLPEKAKWEK